MARSSAHSSRPAYPPRFLDRLRVAGINLPPSLFEHETLVN
jgi:hypothetical protein